MVSERIDEVECLAHWDRSKWSPHAAELSLAVTEQLMVAQLLAHSLTLISK